MINPLRTDSQIAIRLLRAVLAKSLLEFIFVCVIVATAVFNNSHPPVRGMIDIVNKSNIAGWVYESHAPHEPLEVMLFIDDRFVTAQLANEERRDIVAAGATIQPKHGFTFALAPLGLSIGHHTAQVYAVCSTSSHNKMLLPLSKSQVTFQIDR